MLLEKGIGAVSPSLNGKHPSLLIFWDRLCLSEVPSAIAFELQCRKQMNPHLVDLALGSHQQPIPSGAQFTLFDRVASAQLYPA